MFGCGNCCSCNTCTPVTVIVMEWYKSTSFLVCFNPHTVDPTDYTVITNQITNSAGIFGTITHTVEISIVDDAIEEADESFSVELSVSDSVGTLGTPSTLEILIIDDDRELNSRVTEL